MGNGYSSIHQVIKRVTISDFCPKVDGTITRETDDDTTYIKADGSVLKMTEYVEAVMSGDGVELSRRTHDNIAAISEDGVIAKGRD